MVSTYPSTDKHIRRPISRILIIVTNVTNQQRWHHKWKKLEKEAATFTFKPEIVNQTAMNIHLEAVQNKEITCHKLGYGQIYNAMNPIHEKHFGCLEEIG